MKFKTAMARAAKIKIRATSILPNSLAMIMVSPFQGRPEIRIFHCSEAVWHIPCLRGMSGLFFKAYDLQAIRGYTIGHLPLKPNPNHSCRKYNGKIITPS
jgi:hypothetical protein